jgi:hypothetical protein
MGDAMGLSQQSQGRKLIHSCLARRLEESGTLDATEGNQSGGHALTGWKRHRLELADQMSLERGCGHGPGLVA